MKNVNPASEAKRALKIGVVCAIHALVALVLLRTDLLRISPPAQIKPLQVTIIETRPRAPQATIRPFLPAQPRVTPAITLPLPEIIEKKKADPARNAERSRRDAPLKTPTGTDNPWKQFFRDQSAEDAAHNQRNKGYEGNDCVAVDPARQVDLALVPSDLPGLAPYTSCTPHPSLKALQRRNDMYTPK